jgi:hypothetical protein
MESSDEEKRLDAEKLGILRAWGDGLAREEREDVRAAGRAILLLIDEIERLYVELWHARNPVVDEPVESLERSLLARIRESLPGKAKAGELDTP